METCTVAVSPGPHHLRADRQGADPWRWSGDVAAGQALDLLVELAPAVDLDPDGGGGDSGGDIDLGVVVGIGAASLAAVVIAIVVAVVVNAGEQLEPRTPFVLELP